jgi:hypothetical protein
MFEPLILPYIKLGRLRCGMDQAQQAFFFFSFIFHFSIKIEILQIQKKYRKIRKWQTCFVSFIKI